jgi:hypothetical protein
LLSALVFIYIILYLIFACGCGKKKEDLLYNIKKMFLAGEVNAGSGADKSFA